MMRKTHTDQPHKHHGSTLCTREQNKFVIYYATNHEIRFIFTNRPSDDLARGEVTFKINCGKALASLLSETE